MDKSPGMNRTPRGRTWLWIAVGAVVLVALAVLLITRSGGGSGGGIY